jgi:hypothetical protein
MADDIHAMDRRLIQLQSEQIALFPLLVLGGEDARRRYMEVLAQRKALHEEADQLVKGDTLRFEITPAGAQPEPDPPAAAPVTEGMVNRFLHWPLPRSFSPDGGITFERQVMTPDGWAERADMPIGTNLFTATEAKAMLEHVLGPTTTPKE